MTTLLEKKIEKLADEYLFDELSNKKRNKIRNTCYPILSKRQWCRRHLNEILCGDINDIHNLIYNDRGD